MGRYRFDEIAINISEKKKPTAEDQKLYVGLEHLDSGSLVVSRWGSNVPIKGEKLIMRKGDVLLGKRNAYLRRAAIAPHDGIFSAHGMVLRPNENVVDRNFFPFFISSDYFFDEAIRISVGSLSPTVNWSDLRRLEFDLPAMDEQRKLARVLWAVNDTVEAYKRLMAATEELVRGQFAEMFGGIEEKIYLEDCCTVHARVGWQALKKDEYQDTGDYMLITGTDFKDGRVDYSTCVYVSKERYDIDTNIQVQNGDILITKDGTIGKVAIVNGLPKPATLNAGVFVVRPDGRFNVGYFSYLFRGSIFSDFVKASQTGSTIKHLNQSKLLKYKIPVAPAYIQQQFADFVQQTDKSKASLQKALTAAKNISRKIISDNLR